MSREKKTASIISTYCGTFPVKNWTRFLRSTGVRLAQLEYFPLISFASILLSKIRIIFSISFTVLCCCVWSISSSIFQINVIFPFCPPALYLYIWILRKSEFRGFKKLWKEDVDEIHKIVCVWKPLQHIWA